MSANKKKGISAAICAFAAGLILIAVYLVFHIIPMTDIYPGEDREQYCLMVFILALVGILAYWIGRKKVRGKGVRTACYVASFLFVIGVPLIAFLRHSRSFRGADWALETFFIGAAPVLFILAGVSVLFGRKLAGLLLFLVFAFIGIYHIVVLVKMIPRLNQAFNSYSLKDALISILIIALSIWAAWLNLNFFRSPRRS